MKSYHVVILAIVVFTLSTITIVGIDTYNTNVSGRRSVLLEDDGGFDFYTRNTLKDTFYVLFTLTIISFIVGLGFIVKEVRQQRLITNYNDDDFTVYDSGLDCGVEVRTKPFNDINEKCKNTLEYKYLAKQRQGRQPPPPSRDISNRSS